MFRYASTRGATCVLSGLLLLAAGGCSEEAKPPAASRSQPNAQSRMTSLADADDAEEADVEATPPEHFDSNPVQSIPRTVDEHLVQPSQNPETQRSSSPTGQESQSASVPQILQRSPRTAEDHLALREKLDETLWSDEVAAQEHEQPFIRLWDDLRLRSDRFKVLKEFSFSNLRFKEPELVEELDLGIKAYALSGDLVSLDRPAWAKWLANLENHGYDIVQTEWHHSGFVPATADSPASSLVSFAVDVKRDTPVRRASIRGKLIVRWKKPSEQAAQPVAETIETQDVTVWMRDAKPAFEPAFGESLAAKTDAQHKRLMPLIVYDLDRDGLSEILLGGLNKVYWNHGGGEFRPEPIAPNLDIFDIGIVADFTKDGLPDFICVRADRRPAICVGKPDGRFRPPINCASVTLEFPKSMTAGDIDHDGDLDLWIGQYKFPYMDGSMPTPFYDANDGNPSFLLKNDGTGSFEDITVAAGLAAKRNRRTYSSSLVDLDDDGDLDLMTVNDFCGVDMYRNDGDLRFTEVTNAWVDQRHLFGMGHAMADFNLDARLDMYLIGMSSTTARRLDRLQLGREDHPDINRMRQTMGYGNRMLLRADEINRQDGQRNQASPLYQQATFNDHVARTGWSWGTTALDFDNDADRDIYVANGHNSGRSAQDYCTTYWCHDVYTGSSQANRELIQLFRNSLRDLHLGEISWNGFEHNVLMMNRAGTDFSRVGFLMDVAFEFDSRGVVGEDLDADGRPDLLVVHYHSDRANHAEYTLHVLRNQLETNNHWIGVRLNESARGPSPIGARIVVKTPQRTQIHRVVTGDSFSSQHPTAAHFGLGKENVVESIEVHWIDGSTSVLQAPEPGRYYTISAS